MVENNAKAIQLQIDTSLTASYAAMRKPIVSKDERKSADNYYEAYNNTWGGVGSVQWLNKSMDLVNQTKYIPQGMQDQLAGFAIGEDPAAFAIGTQMYNIMKTDTPEVLEQLPNQGKAILEWGARLQSVNPNICGIITLHSFLYART